jgi:hypothetical protein
MGERPTRSPVRTSSSLRSLRRCCSSGNQVGERNDSCDNRKWAWVAMRNPVWGRGQGQSRGKAALLASGGAGGMEEIIVNDLTPEEKAALQRSAKAVWELLDQADQLSIRPSERRCGDTYGHGSRAFCGIKLQACSRACPLSPQVACERAWPFTFPLAKRDRPSSSLPSVVNQFEAVAPSRQPAGILRANTAIARAHVLQSVLQPLPGDLFTDVGNRPHCCWFAPSDRSCAGGI